MQDTVRCLRSECVIPDTTIIVFVTYLLCTKFYQNQPSPITALHGMQTRSYDENNLSVRLSVRLSVKRVHCDKTVEKSVYWYRR